MYVCKLQTLVNESKASSCLAEKLVYIHYHYHYYHYCQFEILKYDWSTRRKPLHLVSVSVLAHTLFIFSCLCICILCHSRGISWPQRGHSLDRQCRPSRPHHPWPGTPRRCRTRPDGRGSLSSRSCSGYQSSHRPVGGSTGSMRNSEKEQGEEHE